MKTDMNFIETHSGKRFFFQKPTADMVCIEDIAYALSNLCRFNGHCKRFYSVAEHSVIISQWLAMRGASVETQMAGLMHDCAEAYIGDMPKPIKITMPNFMEMEKRIEEVIFAKYDLPFPFPSIVKEADCRILKDERAQIMHPSEHTWMIDEAEPLGVSIEGVCPETAESDFMDRFEYLQSQRIMV